MDLIKPPTDNLYKFLAIGGLVLVGFALAFPPQYLSEGNKRFNDIQRAKQKTLTQGGLLFLHGIPYKEIEAYAFPKATFNDLSEIPTAEQTRKTLDHYHNLEIKILRRCNIPQEGDDDAKEYWCHVLWITEAEYQKMLKEPDSDNVLYRTIKEARAFLPAIREIPLLEAEQLDLEKGGKLVRTLQTWGLPVGYVLTLVGFVLWYFKVQRHLDATLKAEATRVETPIRRKEWASRPTVRKLFKKRRNDEKNED